MRGVPKLGLWLTFLIATLAVIGGGHAPGATAALIEGNASLSVDNDAPNNRDITDWEFASQMRNLLIDGNGNANARGAIFLFDTCYGGGMLDDLSAAFQGTNLKWVAASSANSRQKSLGQDSEGEFARKLNDSKNPNYPRYLKQELLARAASPELMQTFVNVEPLGMWTRPLLPTLTNPDLTVLQAAQQASQLDKAGPNESPTVGAHLATHYGQATETGVSAFGNGGDALKLVDPGATSYEAILWAGFDNRARFDSNKQAMRTMLDEQWTRGGAQTINFQDLGNPAVKGAPKATRAELGKALASTAQRLGPDEIFLFYATGHGSSGRPRPVPRAVPNGQQSFAVDLPEEILTAMEIFGASPYVDLTYSGITGPTSVAFNDHPIGTLLPSLGLVADQPITVTFPIDGAWTSLRNEFQFDNAGAEFTLSALDFFPGQCCDFVVPASAAEPTVLSLALAATALAGFVSAIRRRSTS